MKQQRYACKNDLSFYHEGKEWRTVLGTIFTKQENGMWSHDSNHDPEYAKAFSEPLPPPLQLLESEVLNTSKFWDLNSPEEYMHWYKVVNGSVPPFYYDAGVITFKEIPDSPMRVDSIDYRIDHISSSIYDIISKSLAFRKKDLSKAPVLSPPEIEKHKNRIKRLEKEIDKLRKGKIALIFKIVYTKNKEQKPIKP